MKLGFIAAAAMLGSCTAAMSQTSPVDCKAIQDAAARLACFDKSPPAKQDQPKAAPKGDPLIEKAKAAVRAQLKDPPSARFLEAHRLRKASAAR
jgi:hypothetical protein